MEILLVDDHELFTDGVRFILEQLSGDLTIYCESNASSARGHLKDAHRYDLILFDMDIGVESGVQLTQEFVDAGVLAPIVIVSATENLSKIKAALEAGAVGFIPKSFNGEKLTHALKTVLAGNSFVEKQTAIQVKKLAMRQREILEALTKKQVKVLQHLSAGRSNKQIADEMFLTENTVKSHLMSIYQKLNVQNRTECVLKAQSLDL